MLQTEWAFDKDWDRDHKTGRLTPAKVQFPFDSFMDAYGRTKVKRAVSVQELAAGESISIHLRPLPRERHACQMTPLSHVPGSHCCKLRT